MVLAVAEWPPQVQNATTQSLSLCHLEVAQQNKNKNKIALRHLAPCCASHRINALPRRPKWPYPAAFNKLFLTSCSDHATDASWEH